MVDCSLVMITWFDSRQPDPKWQHLANIDLPKSSKCVSVGWLLKDGKKRKILAQSLGDIEDEDGIQAAGVMTIPACCVLKIERLEER